MADIHGPQPTAEHQTTYYESILTGIAFVEAHGLRDGDTMAHLIATVPTGEAVLGILDAAALLNQITAERPQASASHACAELRRRILHEISRAA